MQAQPGTFSEPIRYTGTENMDVTQPDQPPSFETATDAGFVAACREAAGNNLLLEQQDYGRFLGERRLKWHDDPELNSGEMFGFGKAFCFYHRQDGTLVGLCKLGYAGMCVGDE